MPAVPLALAEIEERLEEIRYLLNRRSLTAVIAPVIGALLGLAALVVWSTSYATAQTFGVGLYAAIGAAVLLFAWSGLVLRQRWINLEEAARIADDRANMRQRLQTSLWLARSGQQPSFTPVLVADTLGRRDSWKAAAIIARRLPVELAYPTAGILALAAAIFLASHTPPPVEPPRIAQPTTQHSVEPRAPEQASQPGAGENSEPLLVADAQDENGETTGAHERGDSSMLSEQLRGAIRQALKRLDSGDHAGDGAAADGASGGQMLGAASQHDLSANRADSIGQGQMSADAQLNNRDHINGAQNGRADSNDGAAEVARAAESERADEAHHLPEGSKGATRGDQQSQDGHPPITGDNRGSGDASGTDKSNQAENGKGADGAQSAESAAQANKASGPSSHDGSANTASRKGDAQGSGQGGSRASSGAGAGGASGLFAAKGAAGTDLPHEANSGTFKLTLGSFLSSGNTSNEPPPKSHEKTAASGRAAVSEPPALNPNQSEDDALRRADIPPEYEEIIRRIFSSRPAK